MVFSTSVKIVPQLVPLGLRYFWFWLAKVKNIF
jgi:hypothetical protein